MSGASIRITDGAAGDVAVVIEYEGGYNLDLQSHLIVAQLNAHLVTEIMRGAQSSEAVEMDAETMDALRRDFPAGDWTIKQAAEYKQRFAKIEIASAADPAPPSRSKLSRIAQAVLGPLNG